jgi:hypothetical protein
MTTEESYWPTDLVDEVPQTPLDIMNLQAAALGKRTGNLVIAKVITEPEGDTFYHNFLLVAPTLDYSYSLFFIQHGIDLYPAYVGDSYFSLQREATQNKEIANEDELKTFLKSRLSEERTVRIVRNLLSQAKSAEPAQT